MDAIHVTNSRSSSFSSPPPPPPQVYESLISRSEAAFPYSSHQEIENHSGTSRGGRGMNSLNLQGISWNFFARDRCVSVSITQSRLIARGHHQLRLILFRVGSIPRPRITFFFFFFSSLRGTRERHPIAIRSLYHPPAPLEPRQVPPSKIGVPLSILKVNEINHPAPRYIYIHTASSTSALLFLLFLSLYFHSY